MWINAEKKQKKTIRFALSRSDCNYFLNSSNDNAMEITDHAVNSSAVEGDFQEHGCQESAVGLSQDSSSGNVFVDDKTEKDNRGNYLFLFYLNDTTEIS